MEKKQEHLPLTHEDTSKLLDSISPTICLAKWLKPTLSLSSGVVATCCLAQAESIDPENIEHEPHRLVNPKSCFDERKDLLNGKMAKSCYYCTETGAFDNSLPNERVNKSQSCSSPEEVSRVLTAKDNKNVIPSYLEVSFSNKCNLKCIYCEATRSSSIMDETKKFGPLPIYNGNNSQYDWKRRGVTFHGENDNPYKKAFWKWFPEISNSLLTFRITGGEPLLSKDTSKVLDYFATSSHPNLELVINTNLMVDKKYLERFYTRLEKMQKNVRKISISTSVDTSGVDSEFIRQGLNWERFIENLKYSMVKFPNIDFSITCTFNIFSLFNFADFIRGIEDLKTLRPLNPIYLSTYPLISPSHLAIQYLGEEFRQYIDAIQLKLETSSISSLEKEMILNTLNQFGKDHESKSQRVINYAQFFWHCEELKRRRNKDVLAVFPQLTKFLLECELAGKEVIHLYLENSEEVSLDYLNARYQFLKVMQSKPMQLVQIFEKMIKPPTSLDLYLSLELKHINLEFYKLSGN
jgi:pyruvate-formate lyase-activating enzyme